MNQRTRCPSLLLSLWLVASIAACGTGAEDDAHGHSSDASGATDGSAISGSDGQVSSDVVGGWDASLVVLPSVFATSLGVLESASELNLAWGLPQEAVDHFVVIASAEGAPSERVMTAGDVTSATVTLLRSDTAYTVYLIACLDPTCSASLDGGVESASTAPETWQIHGTGSDYTGATHIVEDGNTKASTIVYGAGAPEELQGVFQLYYDPNKSDGKGVQIATLTGASADDPDSVSQFTTVEGVGLGRKDDPSHQENNGPLTFQVVPLAESLGGGVRIFFEGTLVGEESAQLYSVDSVDGYLGHDFHTGEETYCPYDEIHATGACPTTEEFGFTGGANPAFRQIRQAKLIFPRLDDWRWDGAPGTPMVVTLHHSEQYAHCGDIMFNLAYLVHDGTGWEAVMGDDGCPRSWPGVQAALPVHMGGPRYKLYFNHNTTVAGSGPLISGTKPIQVMYGHAEHTGDEALLDFDDWEGSAAARDVRFVWPSGDELTEEEESKLDDYEVVAPTGDPSFLVMYSNMSCPGGACGNPFIGMAVLLNP